MTVLKNTIDNLTLKDALENPAAVCQTLLYETFWPNKVESATLSDSYVNKYADDQVALLKRYYSSCE